MSFTPDQERWAEALFIEKQHGENTPAWIADRIADLARAGDELGLERFAQIVACLDQLMVKRPLS